MKQLTDTERLEVALWLLDEHQVDDYANRCSELEQDCKHNGFHNVPAECENIECNDCGRDDDWRESVGCPYLENQI